MAVAAKLDHTFELSERYYSSDDPLDQVLRPDPHETQEQKHARLLAEREAKIHSESIDEMLRLERASNKKHKEVKILLLGQSESGKSTTLKQFQLLWAPSILEAERLSWRPVVFLNLVISIRRIIECLSPSTRETDDDERPSTASSTTDSLQDPYSRFAEVKLKLSPVLQLEHILLHELGAPDQINAPNPYDRRPSYIGFTSNRKRDVLVQSEWQNRIAHAKPTSRGGRPATAPTLDPGDAGTIISACRVDIQHLWNDDFVHAVMGKRKLRLEESSGFFLNYLDRIARYDYVPTDEDILRARVRTIGVSEHRFVPPQAEKDAAEWVMYDVGGTRNQRHKWVPYFEDAQAIIFLAPISAFDQTLAEDRTVNRLADSLALFEKICKERLLENASIILFLNKTDLLKAKLDKGVKVRKWIEKYGDRPNDFESVSTYLKSKFVELYKYHRQRNNNSKEIYVHFTAVTDTRTTHAIFRDVKDTIVRDYLRSTKMI